MVDLWFLYTIVLGAAFALVATAMARAVKMRCTQPGSRLFVTGLLWQGFLLLLVVQVWIAVAYYQTTVTQLSVLSLLAFLLVPVGIFVMGTLLDGDQTVNDQQDSPREVFDRVRPVFFATLMAMVIGNIVHEWVLDPRNMTVDSDLLFQLALVAGAVVGLVNRRRTLDPWIALALIVVLCAYILSDYAVIAVAP